MICAAPVDAHARTDTLDETEVCYLDTYDSETRQTLRGQSRLSICRSAREDKGEHRCKHVWSTIEGLVLRRELAQLGYV